MDQAWVSMDGRLWFASACCSIWEDPAVRYCCCFFAAPSLLLLLLPHCCCCSHPQANHEETLRASQELAAKQQELAEARKRQLEALGGAAGAQILGLFFD
jgi:hypothetical protein